MMQPSELGLKLHQYQILDELLLKDPLVEHVWLFGSRALGTYKDNSDIDLALDGGALTISVLAEIMDRFDRSLLPYKVDLLLLNRITSNELRAHIDKCGVKLKG
jgi:predicted nucleotidyltransferase